MWSGGVGAHHEGCLGVTSTLGFEGPVGTNLIDANPECRLNMAAWFHLSTRRITMHVPIDTPPYQGWKAIFAARHATN